MHGALRLQCFLQFVLEDRCVVRMHQPTPHILGNARLVATEKLTEGAVDEACMAALVQHPDRHRQAIGQRTEARFAFAQLNFHLLARGDVEEQDADLVLTRAPHAHRIDRERAAQRPRFHLELRRPAAAGHFTVDAEPVFLVMRFQRAHALSACVLQAGMPLEGIVDLDETVVHRAVTIEQHLDHAETGVDALKHAMMQVRFGRRHHHRWALH